MLTIKEVQQIEADILNEFHIYCKENGFRYVMTYGTLIGAVRHKGFIPWDNDIDVYMPRPDYDRLIDRLKNEDIKPYLKLLHYSNDEKYHYMAARIVDTRTKVIPNYLREAPDDLGVWIDLFAVDGCWRYPFLHPIYWINLTFNKVIQRAHTYYIPGKKGYKNALMKAFVTLFRNHGNKHQAKADVWARKCSYDESEKVTDITDWTRRGYDVYLTHEDFDNPIEMDFEEKRFLAPRNYDRFLHSVYRDYMSLPPEDQRETHNLNVEWRKQNLDLRGTNCESN